MEGLLQRSGYHTLSLLVRGIEGRGGGGGKSEGEREGGRGKGRKRGEERETEMVETEVETEMTEMLVPLSSAGNANCFLFTLRPVMAVFTPTGYNENYMYLQQNAMTLPNGLVRHL